MVMPVMGSTQPLSKRSMLKVRPAPEIVQCDLVDDRVLEVGLKRLVDNVPVANLSGGGSGKECSSGGGDGGGFEDGGQHG